ncbi:hypothetical protein COCC4DRAFT_71750 [Bipolaris maydis ATCC 48331]|uniref:GAR domain-containing protein n=2 Tax=Cochliobolus heterostrophus TaxID=5016 RepID=M2U5G6_COCH5|nr:uncharacterized protein COCC4DRAFT_71750 [Bipolaris maydis ATCC 48331]EMD88966.1 hypothetical protein COCHEDRAFT_1182511 [Bipolaris maydis C5]KAJ5028475.1 hypothetical protein J3E73DRAFT_207325 [Bipolaris maydis]ENI05316.1 hypothetical protein COCC4DRAFT_71750 [Bipolaris maydis ATCC 48331]KAJ5063250.1 hypothetical protein J3E74DRAFT_264095 [Bipolaris maydis]KAJ6199518.1 hypothetical protein J3E72DRAFT_237620 [Bipolaris maydis]
MDAFSSPVRLLPPHTPRRVPSPVMSPSGRRGRLHAGSEDGRLRDLSPETTLRAFTYTPVPFDTTRDEYKIFACIDTLTAAERDLGARVAKAAQRLKAWCAEIEQWGWSGSFEEPSAQLREQKRKSIELRIRQHVGRLDLGLDHAVPPLEYWGSLLSVEVEQHEARLDEIGDEMLKLDVEELKEYVLDMHPAAKSRPSSAGYEATRQHYKVMDDFSFLITQTLLSALPHHTKLKERLNTWTARVSILREAPRYISDLDTAQKAMRLGWDAIEPPADPSDLAFAQWKEAIDTISTVLHQKVSSLGRRLDRMLDTLEGREDCLPEHWIDTFEATEADYGRWKHESRRRLIDAEVRRRADDSAAPKSTLATTQHLSPDPSSSVILHTDHNIDQSSSIAAALVKSSASEAGHKEANSDSTSPSHPSSSILTGNVNFESEPLPSDDESEFDEGDTVVHHVLNESPDHGAVQAESESLFPGDSKTDDSSESHVQHYPKVLAIPDMPILTAKGSRDDAVIDAPQTPRSWRGSLGSFSTDLSPDSSPHSTVEESPSVRNPTTREMRMPHSELNGAMPKRRLEQGSTTLEQPPSNAPWPPSHFTHKPGNSAEELERKISDILTTIPAHIRLTSGPGPNAPEVKPARGLTAKGSRTYLRAARSVSNFKAPELVLSPAKSEFDLHNASSGRRSAAAARGDNDIKLYHLTQPGKEQPVKLFIRRVGENGERVMVRVGGGWSDLGEYLRQYAEHHGRRTASEGKFEVVGLEIKNPDQSPGRPESVMSRRERRISAGYPIPSPSTTPVKASGLGMGISRDQTPPRMPTLHASTPDRGEEPDVPSTTSSRSSWQGKEVGLAGPTSKKLDLSGDKLVWIEGMMKQARIVSTNAIPTDRPVSQRDERPLTSGGSRPGSRAGPGGALGGKKPEFKDLGRVGGTRRLFMKGGNPAFGE